jgi:hypothetical protein
MTLVGLGINARVLAEACPSGNLLANASISGSDIPSDTTAIVDGELTPAGAPWNSDLAMPMEPSSYITFDIGTEREIKALLLQASGGARYRVEASTDGMYWQTIWQLQIEDQPKLLAGMTEFEPADGWRYLRLSVAEGTTRLSVSEFAAFCEIPGEWPPKKLSEQFRTPPWWTQQGRINLIKAAVSLAALVLFLYGMLLQRSHRPQTNVRLRDASLGTLALLSLVLFWNAFDFHSGRFEHRWEFFHYYLGAKYFDELGYKRLYECTTIADVEDGFRQQVEKRKIRNLHINLIGDTSQILADPEQCKRHFSESRWLSFKKDARWFREQMGMNYWEDAQKDHGYNATPVWGIAGSILANQTEASQLSIRLLALLDPLLLMTMWGFVYWAFGWRALCVAMIWWGTNYLAGFSWNGGAYLRMDWLALSIISICLVKKRKMAAGGAALAFAAGLRVFPLLIAIGLVLKALVVIWRARRLTIDKGHLRFAIGALVAGALLLGVSSAQFGSFNVWYEFVDNTRLHLETRVTNNVGLKTVLSYDESSNVRQAAAPHLDDPFQMWKQAQQDTFSARFPIYLIVVSAFIVLLARRVRDEEDWIVLTLGIGMIPVAIELSCYYYSIMLGFGFLWLQSRYAVGASLSALALFTQIVPITTGYNDEIYSAASLAIVVFVFAITVMRPRASASIANQREERLTADR